jgi:hypothetical protein
MAAPGAVLGAFGNPDLKPERSSELEAGLDLDLAEGRVRLELTGYRRTSHDALMQRPLGPDVGGNGRRWENLGSIRNRGLELTLGADVLQGRTLAAGFTLTGVLNENRLLALGEGVVLSSPTDEWFHQDVGYPVNGLWGRKIESFSDANGNGIIEPNEVTLTENQFIGPTFPTREATAAPYVGLLAERLRLAALVQYRGGFSFYNDFLNDSCSSVRSCRAVNDASTPPAEQARPVARSLGAWGQYYEPASYLSLRELSASLTMPPKWARVVRAGEARIVLAARNVALLWQQGTWIAPENGAVSEDTFGNFGGATSGPPTHWLVRLHVNY